jgi:signal transduction histidine kinase/tetratricopeptide (TPR) repeat protein
MSGARDQRKPTFLWQAVLILLPTAVLATIGWLSLRQDRILARHEAAERAQTIADGLVAKVWNELAAPQNQEQLEHFAFQIDDAGQLVYPPPYAPVPVPRPFDLASLNAKQARLWTAAQTAEAEGQNPVSATQAWRDFLESNPPRDLAAAAGYNLGLLLARQKQLPAAAEMFDLVARKYPDAVGESGIPLRPLAQLKLFEVEIHEESPQSTFRSPVLNVNDSAAPSFDSVLPEHYISMEAFCSNIVCYPTALTPRLFNRLQELLNPRPQQIGNVIIVGPGMSDFNGWPEGSMANVQETIRRWQSIWNEHETARQLFSAARLHFHTDTELAPLLLSAAAGESEGDANRSGANGPASALQGAPSNFLAPHLFWFDTPEPLSCRITNTLAALISERHWLAFRSDENTTNHTFVCRGESELGATMTSLMEREKQIPEYFGIGIEVGGKKLEAFAPDLRSWGFYFRGGGKSSGREEKVYGDTPATNVLASAAQSEGGPERLKINVYLTSPAKLYQRQSARAFWFGSLVAASTAAALIGLIAAWRAFYRQQQLGEMKSNFVSSVSHELRAPIASVRLLAESLERGKVREPGKQHEYFRFIVQECRRLSSLIENVLDFSRIEQGRKQYEFEPTDLVALTRETVKLMEPYAAEKQVLLSLKLDDDQLAALNSQPVEVDGRAIQQALVNLIDNAIKHSPKGEMVTVGIESGAGFQPAGLRSIPASRDVNIPESGSKDAPPTRTQDACATSVLLWVEDHGPGIPAEEHEKIFERFYRRGSELRRETQGVGIGLSIVKHIVEAHGGRIIVRSGAGQGSRFAIELPMKKIETTDERR